MASSIEQSRAEILAVHKAWWEANMGLRIEEMSACFPSGDNYLMFNLNGHPYFGIAEKVKLWEFYVDQLEIPEIPDLRIMKLEIHGDMAWLACEGRFPIREIGAEGTAAELLQVGESVAHVPLRATEIYHRDDGAGKSCVEDVALQLLAPSARGRAPARRRRHLRGARSRLEPVGRTDACGRAGGRGWRLGDLHAREARCVFAAWLEVQEHQAARCQCGLKVGELAQLHRGSPWQPDRCLRQ